MDIELGHYPNRTLSKLIRNFETENAVKAHALQFTTKCLSERVRDFGLADTLTRILTRKQNLQLFIDQQAFSSRLNYTVAKEGSVSLKNVYSFHKNLNSKNLVRTDWLGKEEKPPY